jgi:hypothetical protein
MIGFLPKDSIACMRNALDILAIGSAEVKACRLQGPLMRTGSECGKRSEMERDIINTRSYSWLRWQSWTWHIWQGFRSV